MSFDIDAQTGTMAVREQHRFDEAALQRWMAEHVEGYEGPLRIEQFKGGQSNPTFRISTPGRDYVMRRKPPGPLLKGAHAIDREARVITSVASSGFPVPHIFGLCTDDAIIGSWFYIMEMVEGRIFWDATLPGVAEDRAAYFDAMNAAMAKLHGLDQNAIGLSGYGREGGYFARQIHIWSSQYFSDAAAGRDANMDRLIDWLQANLPASDETSLVHGDFRIDNMIFHPTEPRIVAVLDWELSTLGHPVADFAYHAMMYRMPPLIVPGLAGTDIAALGIPSEEAYVEAYCRRTGRSNLSEYSYAMVFNFFRFAAILHGIRGRVIRGTASNREAKARAEAFTHFAALAWEQVSRLKGAASSG
ncbi:phosphotransferase [Sphingopyxis sp.]|uniref:phosphotransferase n=1 Tax=Sphingopyxis sp. TaxID=1908224 RepID=UPI002DF0DF9A|nr:phosphotransferase [Sphingopyxis sp.]